MCAGTSQAQDNPSEHYLKVTDTVRSVDNGQTFSIEAGVHNPDNKVFAGRFRIMTDSGLDLISRQDIAFSVEAGKSYFTSVQIRVPIHTSSQGQHSVRIELK